ncbi:MAG: hypothetical protein ACOYXB_03455 [Bacteroidota bacterium]
MKKGAFLIVILFLVLSCRSEQELKGDTEADLIGFWAERENNDTLEIYTRVGKLDPEDYGFAFGTDHMFTERANAGWCGTPPVTYTDYSGEWHLTGEEISISVAYWGGVTEQTWEIIKLDKDHLTVYRKSFEQLPSGE